VGAVSEFQSSTPDSKLSTLNSSLLSGSSEKQERTIYG